MHDSLTWDECPAGQTTWLQTRKRGKLFCWATSHKMHHVTRVSVQIHFLIPCEHIWGVDVSFVSGVEQQTCEKPKKIKSSRDTTATWPPSWSPVIIYSTHWFSKSELRDLTLIWLGDFSATLAEREQSVFERLRKVRFDYGLTSVSVRQSSRNRPSAPLRADSPASERSWRVTCRYVCRERFTCVFPSTTCVVLLSIAVSRVD